METPPPLAHLSETKDVRDESDADIGRWSDENVGKGRIGEVYVLA